MHLILEVASGPDKGKKIESDAGQTITVGRTSKANVALTDTFLSGVHFAVECSATVCQVRDLKSRNGTKLNGKLIIEAPLKDGDRLYAGHTDFTVRIQDAPTKPLPKKPRTKTGSFAERPKRKVSQKIQQLPVIQPEQSKPRSTPREKPKADRVEPAPAQAEPPVRIPIVDVPKERPIAQAIATPAIESYEAATPQGRLLHLLSNQPQPVMALLDAVRDQKVLRLLETTREEHQSLYRVDANPAISPYLVRLPPRCDLLKQMIQFGWGNGWGVYLTCAFSVAELREYFRTTLMVRLADGAELFSRFYDPRFFRTFLETCTAPEAEKFFGPITAYFMEDERPEILLQFTLTNTGVEKRGHLLSPLG